MAQIDLGDGFYYKQGYGIYCLDLDQEVARTVFTEQELKALTRWQEYLHTIAGASKNIESAIRKEYAGGVVITLDDGRKLYDKRRCHSLQECNTERSYEANKPATSIYSGQR